MTSTSSAHEGDERFSRLYERHRTRGIKYAAMLIARPSEHNKYLLGIEAEDLFDEAMELYYKFDEHLPDHDQHERNIKQRIRTVYIALLRRVNTQSRRPPGTMISLESPVMTSDGEQSETGQEVPDPQAAYREDLVDIEDALERIPNSDQRSAAIARYEGATYDEIGGAAGISNEAARQRVKRAGERLRDALEEDDP